MQPRDFCYWLQGFFELTKTDELTPEQVGEIKKHLYNVFQHDCEKIKYKDGTIVLDDSKDYVSSWMDDTNPVNPLPNLTPFIVPTDFQPIDDKISLEMLKFNDKAKGLKPAKVNYAGVPMLCAEDIINWQSGTSC